MTPTVRLSLNYCTCKDWDLPAALTQVRAKLRPHAALRLKIEPAADCGRYDRIRKIA
jgi:hypothetical protein